MELDKLERRLRWEERKQTKKKKKKFKKAEPYKRNKKPFNYNDLESW